MKMLAEIALIMMLFAWKDTFGKVL